MLFDVSEIRTNAKKPLPVKKTIAENKTYSAEDIIKLVRKVPSKDYDFFTEEKFPHGFVFYDFEVFMYDWLVVLIDPIEKTKTIIANSRTELRKYYNSHKTKIWVGYNNLHYDVPILKGILSGMNPKQISDDIIVHGKNVYDILDKRAKDIPLLSYDISDGVHSLKVFEAFMGDDIEETDVPFDIERPLTQKEINMTVKYCIHDVEETIEVFMLKIDDFNAVTGIINMAGLDITYVDRTLGQLTAIVVDCEKKEHNDEFNITFLPCIQLKKYAYVKDWFEKMFKNKTYSEPLENNEENAHILKMGKQVIKKSKTKQSVSFETTVCGIPHQFGFGGLHGASNKPVHTTGNMHHCDVTSYYPSMMIQWDFLTRNSRTPSKFKDVYETRVALKKAGKKKEQAPYKIVLNSQYGITKFKSSTAFDPVQANNICINGQLMLLDLLEHLEYRLGDKMELIQSNTDGIIIKLAEDEKTMKIYNHVCKNWCERTRMGLGDDKLINYIAKDVNNYVFVFENGKLERKGAYVKENSLLDNDLPIINEALVQYMIKGIPVEETINNCNDMIMFQKIFRISKEYKVGWHNNQYLNERTFRIFASKDIKDTVIARCRDYGTNPDTFQNSPEHCFIYNKAVKDMPMSIKLDKNWYIKLAKKRLEDFGYTFKKEGQLF